MARHTLTEDFELSGLGWMPTSPQDRFAVTIRYQHENHIEVAITSVVRLPVEIPVLHVIVLSSGCASLLALKSNGSSQTLSGASHVIQTLYSARLLVRRAEKSHGPIRGRCGAGRVGLGLRVRRALNEVVRARNAVDHGCCRAKDGQG